MNYVITKTHGNEIRIYVRKHINRKMHKGKRISGARLYSILLELYTYHTLSKIKIRMVYANNGNRDLTCIYCMFKRGVF